MPPERLSVHDVLVASFRVVLALVLTVGLIPGGGEMFEDVGNLILSGHLEEGSCADACDLSGCTPGSHACTCCSSSRVTAAEQRASVPPPGASGALDLPSAGGSARAGFSRRLPRPPSA